MTLLFTCLAQNDRQADISRIILVYCWDVVPARGSVVMLQCEMTWTMDNNDMNKTVV